jgi:hypothetical protein
MITCILMDSIVELPCKRQKYSEHFMVIYDIVWDLSRSYRIPSSSVEGAILAMVDGCRLVI